MNILGLCVTLCLVAGVYCGCHVTDTPPELCLVAYRCSNDEHLVWTTSDDRLCEVFRNECHMSSSNCDRINQNKPIYREIGQAKCQELCRETMCLTVYQPVCGSYKGKYRTFGNDCEMKRHICTTGETFSLYKEEACPK